MKSNLRDKFCDFLASEEGRVGVKAPLAVGIAGGSLLLAQAMQAPAHPGHVGIDECLHTGCPDGEACIASCQWSPNVGCLDHINFVCVND